MMICSKNFACYKRTRFSPVTGFLIGLLSSTSKLHSYLVVMARERLAIHFLCEYNGGLWLSNVENSQKNPQLQYGKLSFAGFLRDLIL